MAKVLWEYKITDKPADPNEDKDDEGKSWLDILRTAEPIRWLTQREIDAIISERENPEDPWVLTKDEQKTLIDYAVTDEYLFQRLRAREPLNGRNEEDIKEETMMPVQQLGFADPIPLIEHHRTLQSALPSLIVDLVNIVRDYLVIIVPRWSCAPDVPLNQNQCTTTVSEQFDLKLSIPNIGERIRLDFARDEGPKLKLWIDAHSVWAPSKARFWITIICHSVAKLHVVIGIETTAIEKKDIFGDFGNDDKIDISINNMTVAGANSDSPRDYYDDWKTSSGCLITCRISDGFLYPTPTEIVQAKAKPGKRKRKRVSISSPANPT